MKRLKLYMILGFLFTAALGTIWHFLYDWTGRGAIAALFFPVNESTWEHMKLIFFPMLLCTVFLAARFLPARRSPGGESSGDSEYPRDILHV